MTDEVAESICRAAETAYLSIKQAAEREEVYLNDPTDEEREQFYEARGLE